MSKDKIPPMPEWEIKWGEKTIPLNSQMVLQALDKGISSVMKEISFNPVIKSDVRLLADWEQGFETLKVIRAKFQWAEEMEAAKHVRLRVPAKKA